MSINIVELCQNLETLGQIGFVEHRGTSRVAYSDDFLSGQLYVKKLMEDAGLKTYIDPVGNLIGFREGLDHDAPKVVVGSHIDSVPNGGIYDGCLGVLGAIECIREMNRCNFKNIHPIEVVAFIEEEGNAVGGTFGSKCFTGMPILLEELEKAKCFGISSSDILAAKRNKNDYCAYVELHIEQGGILENEAKDIGIVEGIVGIARFHAEIFGDANHAGTTPMVLRNDAMQKSAVALGDLYQRVSLRDDGMVCTIGIFDIENPAVNVIPAKTNFCIEARHSSSLTMHQVLNNWIQDYSSFGLNCTLFSDQKETLMNSCILNVIENACQAENFSYKRMFSGAGHDAMNLANFTPSAMIFVPSVSGISHSIKEFSSAASIQKGTQILYDVLCALSLDE